MRPLDAYDAVFFDLDNTLYPFRADVDRVLDHVHRAFADELGPVDAAGFKRTYWSVPEEMADEEIWDRLNEDADAWRVWLFQQVLHHLDRDADGLAETMAGEFVDHRFATMEAFPGALETVREARERTTVGVITNGPSGLQRPKIEGLGIPDLVPEELILVSGEVGVHKPAPGIFETAADVAGADPTRCLMIGDGLEFDVPSKALGWSAIWFNAVGLDEPDGFEHLDHAPDAVARSVPELRAHLGLG